MASKQRSCAHKKERTTNQLADVGISNIPDLDILNDNSESVIDERALVSKNEVIFSGKAVNGPPQLKKKGPSKAPKKVHFPGEENSCDDSVNLDIQRQLFAQSFRLIQANVEIEFYQKKIKFLEGKLEESQDIRAKYEELQEKFDSLSTINENLKNENETLKIQIGDCFEAKKKLDMVFEKPQDSADTISEKGVNRSHNSSLISSESSGSEASGLSYYLAKASADFTNIDDSAEDTISEKGLNRSHNSSLNSSESSGSEASGLSYYLAKASADFTNIDESAEELNKRFVEIMTVVLKVLKSSKAEVKELRKEKEIVEKTLKLKILEFEKVKVKANNKTSSLRSRLQEEKKKKELLKTSVQYQEYHLKKFQEHIKDNDRELSSLEKQIQEYNQDSTNKQFEQK